MTETPNSLEGYQSLGFFLVAWNTYEEILELGIWKLSGMTPENTHIVMGTLTTHAKACILQSLASANLDQSDARDVCDIVKSIHDTAGRNLLVHGHIW